MRRGRRRDHRQGKLAVTKAEANTELSAKHIIIATGARARDLPFAKADGERIWTYRHAMVPKEMPTKLLVIGSGAIGIEFASFYSDIGRRGDRDRDARPHPAGRGRGSLRPSPTRRSTKQGMKIHVGATSRSSRRGGRAREGDDQGQGRQGVTDDYSHAIVAIGIVPNSENIGLEALGVKTDRGHIVVDGYARTSVEGIYAIGDVTGPPWLAHKAMPRGRRLRRGDRRQQAAPVPNREHPGLHLLASRRSPRVGLTEAKAKEAGHKVKVGRFPSSATARRSRSARPRGSSRPCSTPRPASCSAPT